MDEIDKIRTALGRLPPLPWAIEGGPPDDDYVCWYRVYAADETLLAQIDADHEATAVANFIDNASEWVPALLDALDAVTADRDRYRDAIYTYFRAHDEAATRAEQSAARRALWATLDDPAGGAGVGG